MKKALFIFGFATIFTILTPSQSHAYISETEAYICQCKSIQEESLYLQYIGTKGTVSRLKCDLLGSNCDTSYAGSIRVYQSEEVAKNLQAKSTCLASPSPDWRCSYFNTKKAFCGCELGDTSAECKRFFYYNSDNPASDNIQDLETELSALGRVLNPDPANEGSCKDIEKPSNCCCKTTGGVTSCDMRYTESDKDWDKADNICRSGEVANPVVDGGCSAYEKSVTCCCLPKTSGYTSEGRECNRFELSKKELNGSSIDEWCKFNSLGWFSGAALESIPMKYDDKGNELGCSAVDAEQYKAPDVKGFIMDLNREAIQLNPMNLKTGTAGVNLVVGRIVRYLLMFIGSISLVLYIYAGILWMAAGGNSENVGKSKKILLWTTLGLVVMLSSYWIVSTVLGYINK